MSEAAQEIAGWCFTMDPHWDHWSFWMQTHKLSSAINHTKSVMAALTNSPVKEITVIYSATKHSEVVRHLCHKQPLLLHRK